MSAFARRRRYGCKVDMEQSRIWAERARLRGYNMQGVYCSAP